MFEMMLYPMLALLGVALLSGAYGCQMIWHKVACLGDTLSHGALLGIAFGAFTGLNENVSLFLLSVVWAFFLWLLSKKGENTTDTIMAFLMQASMALAILFFALAKEGASMMHAFIGDVLMIGAQDVLLIGALDIILGLILIFCWNKWTLIAISSDLAKAKGIHISWMQFLFFTAISFFVAMTMKLMGALLAPAFFVIPAMTARLLSKTPEKMAILSTLLAIISSFLGIYFSFQTDLPTGASVVVVCLSLYVGVIFYLSIKNMLIKGAHNLGK